MDILPVAAEVADTHIVAEVELVTRNNPVVDSPVVDSQIQAGEGQVCCMHRADHKAEEMQMVCYIVGRMAAANFLGQDILPVVTTVGMENSSSDTAGSDSEDTTFQLKFSDQIIARSRGRKMAKQKGGPKVAKVDCLASRGKKAGDDEDGG